MRHIGQLSQRIVFATTTSLLLLTGCGSTQKPVSTTSVATEKPVQTVVEPTVELPSEKLNAAQQVWQSTRDKEARDRLLLDAASLYMAQNDIAQAKAILVSMKKEGIPSSLSTQFNALLFNAFVDDTASEPQLLLSLLDSVPSEYVSDQARAQYEMQLFTALGQPLNAANSALASPLPEHEKVQYVWQRITQLSQDKLDEVNLKFPALQPFVALRALSLDDSFNEDTILQFQSVYRGHILSKKLPENVALAMTIKAVEPEKLTVLLPLSGRLARTGQAVKDGIMAAYFNASSNASTEINLPTLDFIDTVDKTPEAIIASLGDTRFVIGPLLKDTIDALIPLLPPTVNMLALNRPDGIIGTMELLNETALPETTFADVKYFALAPEDEALQLAQYIFDKGLRAPIVISSQSSLYGRMNDAFVDKWNTLSANHRTPSNVTTVSFSDSGSLKDGITEALDVAQSNKRINQIEYMTNDEVYNMPRSRRDIDAIIAFASPQDTELLNPIIEASLNPYDGKQVPVYATSRSMDYDSGKNQWRDLKNIHFLDMPWLMPEHKWQPLAQLAKETWPERTTLQNRLFAFGFDAYDLLSKVGYLSTLPYASYEGLSGKLSINEHGEVIRLLPQGIIQNEEVQRLTE
ncbi:penicillin-binding protein activator [Alteromonas sp. A079]|uniref:penicillin-binding protein activator n=1 Tax=Alteromonas sp. A079 TaxID=3410268 RepID=UPI003B9F10B8